MCDGPAYISCCPSVFLPLWYIAPVLRGIWSSRYSVFRIAGIMALSQLQIIRIGTAPLHNDFMILVHNKGSKRDGGVREPSKRVSLVFKVSHAWSVQGPGLRLRVSLSKASKTRFPSLECTGARAVDVDSEANGMDAIDAQAAKKAFPSKPLHAQRNVTRRPWRTRDVSCSKHGSQETEPGGAVNYVC